MKKKIIGILFILFGLFGIYLIEKFAFTRPFSIDRFFMFLSVDIFIGINIIFDYKKIWDFIYKKRYLIGIIIFMIVVIRGYNGSSIYAYNEFIEPSYHVEDSIPILGNYRSIRSDEFLVDTPAILSQYNRNSNFSKINNALMARETTVYMYPQLPTKTISVLNNPRLIGFLFLDIEQAYSFYWYFPYFALFFSLFELFMILTKKNKILSLLGTIMLEFSPSLLWWNSPAFLLYGGLATIFFHQLLKEKEKLKKCIYAILLGWAGSCYIMILYPAWQITYGYLFLGLFIYIIMLNKDHIKWTDFLYLILTILSISVLVIPAFLGSLDTINAMMSTVYPGARISTGGEAWELYFNYFPSIFFSKINTINPCESAQYISFYPIPIIIGIIKCYQNYKEKKNNNLLLILTIIAVLLSIWNYLPIGVIAKLTLLSMSTPDRAQLTVGVVCIFILIELFNSYEKENCSPKNKLISIILSIIFCSIGLYISNKNIPNYMTTTMLLTSGFIFIGLSYLVLINTKLGNKIFTMVMIMFSAFLILTIHPVNKGLSVMLEKPLAKTVQEISKKDKEAIWVAVDAPLLLQSYLLANGARVLNSTNYYPNLELWKKFDPEGNNNEVYNRYAHIVFDITENETSFELVQSDMFRVYLNKSDICKLNANYIASTVDLEKFEIEKLNKIYQYENILIYNIDCN